ncbi:MAG: radical SAM protein, partial [Proteobacteria bacterium]|nr:radical SAM protein [Pseudomonadota bacterium]
GKRMTGEGVYAELLARRFELAAKRLGLNRPDWELDTTQFVRPTPGGEQLALF